ncbi:MAG: esterase [Spirochaetaceae bacterium]|nr:MAG: esterase [Spirochaetaceae bacterium]
MKRNQIILCLGIFLVYFIAFAFCEEDYHRPTGNASVVRETDRLKVVWVQSRVLEKPMRVIVFLPDGYTKETKYPVLYLLHGYSNIEDNWFTKVEIHRAYDKLIASGRIVPLITVSPEIDNSYGINSADKPQIIGSPDDLSNNTAKGRYEDWLYQELIPHIDAHYSTAASREARFIGGQSMGGFAALHLAFRHPDLFSKVGGHMPGLSVDPAASGNHFLYPDEATRQSRDPIMLAQNKDLTSLKVYLDVGDKDGYRLWEGCEKLSSILKGRGVSVEYHLNKGDHSSYYVKTQVENYLLFYAGK